MKYVYFLVHSHLVEKKETGNINDTKIIGYFSSYEKAKAIAEQYKEIVGFRDYTNGFIIEKIEIDFDDFDIV